MVGIHALKYCYRELAPYNPDWYYVRAAAVARKVYLRPGRGVGGLRKAFGSVERRGVLTNHHKKAAGGVIRHILKQLEKLDVVQMSSNGGRKMTSNGQQVIIFACFAASLTFAITHHVFSQCNHQDLDRIAGQVVHGDE